MVRKNHRGFASDNYAGALPEVMKAISEANEGHVMGYGADELSNLVKKQIKSFFDAPEAEVFFVFNGTGANVLCLATAASSHKSVLVADVSHFYNDEGSAPENFSGCRLFPITANKEGKLEAEAVSARLKRKGDVHYAQPALLSITQSTEYGSIYQPEEIQQLSAICKEAGMYLHMDGSRFFNALSTLGCSAAAITKDVGVDLLCLGGTKAGMLFGEAIIVFNHDLIAVMRYKHKQAMQLASKTRFISAQFGAMLKDDCWKRYATHANTIARHLAEGLQRIPAIKITKPVQANGVFAILPKEWIENLQSKYPFYVWDEASSEVRFMCAWDNTQEDVQGFLNEIQKLV